MNETRPNWDEYFMEIMDSVSKRATCDRGKAGCVIVKDKRILATGYVGSPAGCNHCDDIGHELHEVLNEDGSKSKHCVRTAHAEQNAIATAARFGIALEGSTLYCNMTPCYICSKIIINSGIERVVARNDYHKGGRSKEVFKESGVKYELLSEETITYDNMN